MQAVYIVNYGYIDKYEGFIESLRAFSSLAKAESIVRTVKESPYAELKYSDIVKLYIE